MKPDLFDIAPTELLLCAVVALVVIGPKDLPRAMRTVGQFVAKVRGVGRHFRSSFDEMVREAELKEMEEAWAKENARIMREHPPEEAHDAAFAQSALPAPMEQPVVQDGHGVQTVPTEALPTDPVTDGATAPIPHDARGPDAIPADRPHDDEAKRA